MAVTRHPTLADTVVFGAGAKFLGRFNFGVGAKVGSNSVVVKSVPNGATVVGIPGRVVMSQQAAEEQDEREDLRSEIAERYGFDAYAVALDNPDPVANAMGLMLEHMHLTNTKVDELCSVINAMGGNVCTDKLTSLKPEDFEATGIEPVVPGSAAHEAFDPTI